MLDALIKAIQNNQTQTLIIAGLIVILVWLYKEIRNTYIETEKINNERTGKALEVYGELQIELSNYITNKTTESAVEAKLSKAYSYFPSDLLVKFFEWKINDRKDISKVLLEELSEEILRIKQTQKDAVSYRPSDSIDSIGYFLYMVKANSYIQPLKLFFGFILCLIFILIAAQSFFKATNITGKIHLFFMNLNVVSYFLFCLLFFDALSKKRFVHNIKNWFLLFVFIIIPAVMLFFEQWYLAIFGTILFWSYGLSGVYRKSLRS